MGGREGKEEGSSVGARKRGEGGHEERVEGVEKGRGEIREIGRVEGESRQGLEPREVSLQPTASWQRSDERTWLTWLSVMPGSRALSPGHTPSDLFTCQPHVRCEPGGSRPVTALTFLALHPLPAPPCPRWAGRVRVRCLDLERARSSELNCKQSMDMYIYTTHLLNIH